MFHVKHQINQLSFTSDNHHRVLDRYKKFKEQLDSYGEKLLWWNQKVNLVSRDVSRETLFDHIKHSLTLAEIKEFAEAESVLDTGSGGGLPGVPLAITEPEKAFLLNDIVQKKMISVAQMIRELKLGNAKTNAGSIEKIEVSEYDVVITKHAFKRYIIR